MMMMDVCARNKVNCQVKEREKDWTHPFSFNYTINESTSETSTIEKKVKTTIAEGGGRGLGKKKRRLRLTRSLSPFHDSGVSHSVHNGYYMLSQP